MFRFLLVVLVLFMPEIHCDDLCELDHAIVSIYAVDSETGEVLIEKNSDLSLMPSSCMKLVTTGAALHILGSETRFETQLVYDGFIDDGVLRGNLYIQGGGDPTLGSGRIPNTPSWKEQIAIWADAIEKLGLQSIEGNVVGDASKWEKAQAVPSWLWEDLGNYYGAGASALSFHENSYSLFFKPGPKVGDPASILRTDPPLDMLSLQNEVKTGLEGSGDCACIYGSEFSPLQFIRGTIPAAVAEFAIKGSIPDPAAYCAQLLALELQRRGIAIQCKSIAPKVVRTAFHMTYSPTVGEIVHWTNQKSINLYAEHLLKKMGEVLYEEGSTVSGVKAVTGFWRSQQIDLEGFNMVDGSGLSRKNLITTKQLTHMLLKMKKADNFPLFFESLPEHCGARAKPGSMSLAKGYGGYAGKIVFAVIVNQCLKPKTMNEKLNAFLLSLLKAP